MSHKPFDWPDRLLRNVLGTAVTFILAAAPTAGQQNPRSGAAGEKSACTFPMTQPEENACSFEQYQKADRRLDRLYRKVLQSFQKDLTYYKAENDDRQQWVEVAIQKLRTAEQAWVEYRKCNCDAAAQQYEHGTFKPTAWALCMSTTTEHRIDEIRRIYEIE